MKLTFKTQLMALFSVGVIFYASYGLTNFLTAQRENVPEIIFAWEYAIPFWAWTIVPYWSLNVFYALAFFLCDTRQMLQRYVTHLLVAQAIAVVGFLAFPLQISWQKPATSGLFGTLFYTLAGFDQPYNQAPSLHIILTLVVGAFYLRLFPKWRGLIGGWMALIALSILTTYQHHFIDLPTGALVGLSILYALPYDAPSPFYQACQSISTKHRRLSNYYAAGALFCVTVACLGGAWLWLLWGAIACGLVAWAYQKGVGIFQKNAQGKLSFAASALLLPYLLVARANIAYWLRGKAKSAVIFEGTFLGSIIAAHKFDAVLDCCAELSCFAPPKHYQQALMLDLVAPDAETLFQAAAQLENLHRQHQSVLVCCALGYGRSVAVVLTWLVGFGKMPNLVYAINHIQQIRPEMVLSDETREQIEITIEKLQRRNQQC